MTEMTIRSLIVLPSELLRMFNLEMMVIVELMFIVEFTLDMVSFLHYLKVDIMSIIASSECNATITWCDLSPRFFCIDATLLCEFESDKIRINEFE